MFDLVKLLIEKPDQRGKFIIVIAKIALNILFASWLYTHIISPYTVIDVTDFSQWINYITSGRILLGIFLYLVSDVALFHILPALPEYLLNALAKYRETLFNRREQNFILRYLSRFELLEFDKTTERISWAKNSGSFSHFMTEFGKKETKKEIEKIKRSYLDDIFENFLVFTVLYFFLFSQHSAWLTSLIIVSLLLISIFYIIASLFLSMIEQHQESIELMLRTLKEEQTIRDQLKAAGIHLIPVKLCLKGVYFDQFIFHGQQYFLTFIPYPKKISSKGIQRLAQFGMDHEKKILAVTASAPTEESKIATESHAGHVVLINYKNHNELSEKIQGFLSGAEIES